MAGWLHFLSFMVVSFFVFLAVRPYVLCRREMRPPLSVFLVLSAMAIILGMTSGKYGQNWGLPWWIYYTVPALITLLFPALYLKMNRRETLLYLILAHSRRRSSTSCSRSWLAGRSLCFFSESPPYGA